MLTPSVYTYTSMYRKHQELTFTSQSLPLLAPLPALVAGLSLLRRLGHFLQAPRHVHEARQALLVAAAAAVRGFRAADVET